jgi:tryptophan 2,3-dioxygenase
MPAVATLTEYEKYLHVPELLALQKPEESRTHPDELLFQSVHQVEELWIRSRATRSAGSSRDSTPRTSSWHAPICIASTSSRS